MRKLRVAVVKLTSCSGCLNEVIYSIAANPELGDHINVTYFTELQDSNSLEEVDVALVEGSVVNSEQEELLRNLRERSRLLVALGTCATLGGVQALRVGEDLRTVTLASYPNPDLVRVSPDVKSLDSVVTVDRGFPGCPVNGEALARFLMKVVLGGGEPPIIESLCAECKRRGTVCVMVSRGVPCLGPITLAGCGALCPGFGRGCYGCYGINSTIVDKERLEEFSKVVEKLGLSKDDIIALLRGFSHTSYLRISSRG